MSMKARIVIFTLVCCLSIGVQAQTDTLGKCPFFYYGESIETGVYYDSVYCEVLGCLGYLGDFYNTGGGANEYALKMHSDDTLHIIGIAVGYFACPNQIYLSIYDGTNMDVPLAFTRVPGNIFYDTALDSNYLYYLELPGWPNGPYYSYPEVLGMGGSQPGDPRYLWLSYFANGETLSVVGDFYVGSCVKNESTGFSLLYTQLFIWENHDPPYHFPKRPIRVKKEKVWYEDSLTRSFPVVFPILEPKCEAVEEVAVVTDSAGCLVATWDSLPRQEQWVVAFNADGIPSTILDTVTACRWQYCGLPAGVSYQISVRSRCTNLRSYTWSAWNSPIDIGLKPAADIPLRISPNPTTGVVKVNLPEAAARDSRLEVYGTDGRQRAAYDLMPSSTAFTLNLSKLPAGLYVLRLVTTEGVYTSKVTLLK